jgi:hypothetical protein
VLTINGDRNTKKMKKVLAKVNTSLPVLRDTESTTFKAYRAYAIPTIYLIDQQGKIYGEWTGYVKNLEEQLNHNLGFLLDSPLPSRLEAAGTFPAVAAN